MTVFVVYIVSDSNVRIAGVYSSKEKAEENQAKIKKHLTEIKSRRFVSVRIDECEVEDQGD